MSEAERQNRLDSLIRAVRSAAEGDASARIVPSERRDKLDVLAAEINSLLRRLQRSATAPADAAPDAAGDGAARQAADEETLMLRFSIDEAPEAVFWMDQSGRFPYVNEQACRSLGYNRAELTRLHLWDIDPGFPRDRLESEWLAYRKGELGMQHLETWHKRKDGSLFPVEVSSKHIWFGDKEFHVAFVRDIAERVRVERALEFTQFAIDRASIACFWIDRDSRFLYVNAQACRSLGYSSKELLGLTVHDVDPAYTIDVWRSFLRRLRKEGVLTFESSHRRKDGEGFPVEVTANFVEFDGREHSCAFVRDLSDRRRAEAETQRLAAHLVQAQKMESVGRLAGGVAHEFNNMLSVILGSAQLLRSAMAPGDPLLGHLHEIERAATRSRDTARQLLAISRQQVISPQATNLNDVVGEAQATLSHLIGERLELVLQPSEGLGSVRMDRAQVEQVLFNLVVNARDAMPNGGRLAIETANAVVDEARCRNSPGARPGPHVRLSVADEGTGMDPEVQSHLFEPFFTTKEVGKGSGLGLATVYGIVTQNGGFIEVESAPGAGSVFHVFLPAHEEAQPSLVTSEARLPPPGHGRILLVEDDPMVRTTTAAMLERLGYSVEAAETSAQAIALCGAPGASFDLVVSDVVLPGPSGSDLGRRIEAAQPGLRVLFMSGYTSDVIGHHGVLENGVHFIQKPFTMDELARKVREVTSGRLETTR